MNADQESKILGADGTPMTVTEAEEIIESLENSAFGAYIRFDDSDEVLIDGHVKHYELKALLVVMEDKIKKEESSQNDPT